MCHDQEGVGQETEPPAIAAHDALAGLQPPADGPVGGRGRQLPKMAAKLEREGYGSPGVVLADGLIKNAAQACTKL